MLGGTTLHAEAYYDAKRSRTARRKLADFINQILVSRLRRHLDPSDREDIQYRCLSKRQLKPAVQKKWKEIGINVRGGFIMPDTGKVKEVAWEFTELFHDWKNSNFEQTDEFVADLYEIIIDVQRH